MPEEIIFKSVYFLIIICPPIIILIGTKKKTLAKTIVIILFAVWWSAMCIESNNLKHLKRYSTPVYSRCVLLRIITGVTNSAHILYKKVK